jgi:5-formyltetrahydrofolate cyclo-ligase
MEPNEKQALRQRVLAQRDAIPAEDRHQRSAKISRIVMGLPEFREARVVLAYMSMGSEFDTGPIVRAVLERGDQLVLSRVDRAARMLRLHRVRNLDTDLKPGVWGIREPNPDHCPPVAIAELDFILVPGAVFDRQRNRLGYGGGFFDRILGSPDCRATTVACAFSEQIAPAVPMEPHDCPVDLLVTDHGIIR